MSKINRYFIENINEYLGIRVEIIGSERFELEEDKTERLVNICKEMKATDLLFPLLSDKEFNDVYFLIVGENTYSINYENVLFTGTIKNERLMALSYLFYFTFKGR